MDKAELRIQIRRSIEELSELSAYVSEYSFYSKTIIDKIEKVLDRLNKSTEILMGDVGQTSTELPSQIISTQDKISQLDDEIDELYQFTFLSGINHSYNPKGLKKLKGALKDLEEYRGILEGDIKKRYTGHPSYKRDLDDDVIEKLFKQLNSFRAVGKVLGCDGKTVKERLIRMGHIKE